MGASVHPTLGFLHPKAKVCDSVTRPATNSVVVPREADGVPRQDGRGHPPLLDLQMARRKCSLQPDRSILKLHLCPDRSPKSRFHGQFFGVRNED